MRWIGKRRSPAKKAWIKRVGATAAHPASAAWVQAIGALVALALTVHLAYKTQRDSERKALGLVVALSTMGAEAFHELQLACAYRERDRLQQAAARIDLVHDMASQVQFQDLPGNEAEGLARLRVMISAYKSWLALVPDKKGHQITKAEADQCTDEAEALAVLFKGMAPVFRAVRDGGDPSQPWAELMKGVEDLEYRLSLRASEKASEAGGNVRF